MGLGKGFWGAMHGIKPAKKPVTPMGVSQIKPWSTTPGPAAKPVQPTTQSQPTQPQGGLLTRGQKTRGT